MDIKKKSIGNIRHYVKELALEDKEEYSNNLRISEETI